MILCTAFVLTVLVSRADARPIPLGLRAGVNLGRLSYNKEFIFPVDHQFRLGLLAEIDIRSQLTSQLEIESGLGIESRGGRYRIELPPDEPAVRHVTRSLVYLVVPARLRMYLASGPVRPTATAGVQVGALLSATDKHEVEFRERTAESDVEVDDELEMLDLGLLAGGGIEFPFGRHRGFAELEYQLGLTDINGVPARRYIDGRELTIHTRTFRLAAGIRL